jgi:hypothetical protein
MASDARSASYQRMLACQFQEHAAQSYAHAREAMENDKYIPRVRAAQFNAAFASGRARHHFEQATDGRS